MENMREEDGKTYGRAHEKSDLPVPPGGLGAEVNFGIAVKWLI
jgi:hypothetical protein